MLVGIDGIQFFSSTKVHCPQCSQQVREGVTHYHHRALTALVVHPEQSAVLPLAPEFLLPQDGSDKQDSELAAAKRWLPQQATWLQQQKAVILGDDLFSHQPFCELVLIYGLDFILVCSPVRTRRSMSGSRLLSRASCLKLVVASGTVVTGKSGGIGISMIYRCVRVMMVFA
ncbi:MAG: hypothetical protein IPM39_09795 [Chloroflexi bacterium]|nr:hypothetical protein [Chloroflexota bacterium]